MPGPTLDIDELAAELGRSVSWLYEHWQTEAAARRLPKPLHDGAAPLRWSRAQVYACLDRSLDREARIAAAAHRAAADAAREARNQSARERLAEESRARLEARFGGLAAGGLPKSRRA